MLININKDGNNLHHVSASGEMIISRNTTSEIYLNIAFRREDKDFQVFGTKLQILSVCLLTE